MRLLPTIVLVFVASVACSEPGAPIIDGTVMPTKSPTPTIGAALDPALFQTPPPAVHTGAYTTPAQRAKPTSTPMPTPTNNAVATALLENACNSVALQHYDYESESRVEDIDNDHTYTLIQKVRIAPNGSHILVYSPDYNHDLDLGGYTSILEEHIFLSGVGLFIRARYPRNPTEWTDWNAQYWTEKEREILEGNWERIEIHVANICRLIDSQNLLYVGPETLVGESVQHFAAEFQRKAEDDYTSEDYKTIEYWFETIEYWIDESGRLWRVDTEEHFNFQGHNRFISTTTTFSNFGEENVITDPLAPSGLE